MANFKDAPRFSTHDDYYTPKKVWEQVVEYLPSNLKNSTVFEPCLLNSNEQSKKYLTELGFNVVGDKSIDFLDGSTYNDDRILLGDYDLIITNPPFQRIKSFKDRHNNLKYKILKGIIDTGKPFIIILNSTNMFQKWFKELFGDLDIKFILPSTMVQYDKYAEGGREAMDAGGGCSFKSVYITYKILDRNIWI